MCRPGWTDWGGGYYGVADVEGDSFHRGEHNCDGNSLGGPVDELLPTSQHQDAV